MSGIAISRLQRISKRQKHKLMDFLELHPLLVNGSTSPEEFRTLTAAWEECTVLLNQYGPKKTTRQWKDCLGELKSKVRKKAREIHFSGGGTGGGPPSTKVLSAMDERLLGLINKKAITGLPNVVEPGIGACLSDLPSTSTTPPTLPICPLENVSLSPDTPPTLSSSTAQHHIEVPEEVAPRSTGKKKTTLQMLKSIVQQQSLHTAELLAINRDIATSLNNVASSNRELALALSNMAEAIIFLGNSMNNSRFTPK